MDTTTRTLLTTAIVSLATALLAAPLFRRLALRRGWLDLPNERSLHTRPVPRAGGLALAAAMLVSLSVAGGVGFDRRTLAWALGAGLLVTVGFRDDLFHVGKFVRLLCQAVAALAVIVAADAGLGRLPLPPPLDVPLGPFGGLAAVLWVMVVINFVNFLDGIDGLATLQAMVTGLGIALAAWDPSVTTIAIALAAACLGFLPFNWQPARMFLGDAGSNLLGFCLATAPLLAPADRRPGAVLFTAMSLWLFVADASFTLVRRILRGETWYKAHREHLYQQIVLSGWSHRRVTVVLGAASMLLTTAALFAWRADSPRWTWAVLALAAVLFGAELLLCAARRRLAAGWRPAASPS